MTVLLKYTLSNKLHTDIVLGKDKSFPRSIAIKMLPSSKVPNSADLLRRVLEGDTEESGLRRLAAVSLWRLNTPEALGYLRTALETVKNPVALTGVVKCLGRVGDESALKAIMKVKKTARGVLRSQASFAASLISYRLGLRGNDLPMPREYVRMPRTRKQELKFVSVSKVEVELFTDFLITEPFGIELSRSSLLHFSCPGGRWMIGFNRDITGTKAIESMWHRKTLLGIIAAKHNEDGHYSASYLILTKPRTKEAKIDILITRITGEPAWAGTTTSIIANQVKFAIRTVGRIGIAPLKLEGFMRANGKVSITSAISGTHVSETRHPLRLPDIETI